MSANLKQCIFVQLCVTLLDEWNLQQLIVRIGDNLPFYTNSKFGTRLIQVIIEKIEDMESLKMFNQLMVNYLDIIISDPFGSYAVTKYLECINSPYNNALYMKITQNAASYAVGKFSNKVLTRSIYYSTEQQMKAIIVSLMKDLVNLLTDKFGHTVIQYLLVLMIPEVNNYILQIVMTNVATFSRHIFAAGVLTKVCI